MKTYIREMKQIGLIFIGLCFSLVAFGQSKAAQDEKSRACEPGKVFSIVEEMPSYTGGNEALLKALNDKIDFSAIANGRLYVRFLVNCKGEASGFEVLRGPDEEINKKLVIELKGLSNWKSGRQDGRNVDCIYILALNIQNNKLVN